MCLKIKWTEKQLNEWLKDKPEIVIAYKVAKMREGKLYPLFFGKNPFEKENKLDDSYVKEMSKIETADKRSSYKPHYHFFADREAAKDWHVAELQEVLLKCEIPKTQITAMGIGEGRGDLTIVAKEFTFVKIY